MANNINITFSKADMGLENVDNTSDLNKPISTATQTALDDKVDKEAGSRLITSAEATLLGNTSGTNTGDQDLQSVVTAGNTTDTDIQFGDGVGVLLNNTSRLREGTIDSGAGGGVAQICAVGYELKWEAGSQYVMDGNGLLIREVNHKFTSIPDANNDNSQGFYIGSRWILDNGDLYICTDSTTATAVWELQTIDTVPTDGSVKAVESNGVFDALADKVDKVVGERLITSAESTLLGNTSGVNTGDQTISDATISLTDITTNDFSTTKHGFVPKGTNTGKFLKDDGTWSTVSAGITGSGTINTLSKFTSSGAIGNSLIKDDGSNIAVNGTIASAYKLGVYSTTAGENYTIYGNTTVNGAVGVSGVNQGVGASTNFGASGTAQSSTSLNVGVYGQASGASTVNIGGKFVGSGATTNYSAQLQDGTEGVGKVLTSMTADGKAQWATPSGANIPQANKIYVDSINGVNSTGRGNINNPYLTPEYALADITNTGTVTATTTSTSSTLTSVSSTANIVVGQFITGTGIPYNTIVVSKTSNTIVLSKACTASATITATWWTIYEVILNGNFVVTSNIHKTGFYINSKSLGATISYGNLTLFTFTANILIPFYLSLGKTFGTHANSGLINPAGFTAIEGFLDLGNYYSICTGYNLGNIGGASYLTFTNLSINTEMFDCRFGYVSLIAVSGNFTWNGNAYGLLGGLRYTSGYVDINTKITTPASIVALNGTATRGNINGTILGSYTHGGGINLYANIVGTTATIDSGDYIKSVNVYGSLTVTTVTLGGSPVILDGDVTGNVIFNGFPTSKGSVVNGSINGTVTVNSGSIKFNGNQEGTAVSRYMTVIIGAGTFINSGLIRLTALTYTGVGKFINDGTILTYGATATSAPIKLTNSGQFINNKDLIFDSTVEYMPLIEKTDGVLVNNGRMSNPCNMYVKYAANTSVSKEVILAYAMSNGNTYGNSTSGTGDINKFVVSLANTNTVLTIFDGTNTVIISVVGAGKSIAVISAEIVTLVKASILLFQNCSYSSTYGFVVFIPRAGFTATFTVTTNIGSIGTYAGGGGFAGTLLGAGTELLSSSYNY